MNTEMLAEMERLAFEALEASKRAETFEQRYQAAMVFAQCHIALRLDRLALALSQGRIAVVDINKV